MGWEQALELFQNGEDYQLTFDVVMGGSMGMSPPAAVASVGLRSSGERKESVVGSPRKTIGTYQVNSFNSFWVALSTIEKFPPGPALTRGSSQASDN